MAPRKRNASTKSQSIVSLKPKLARVTKLKKLHVNTPKRRSPRLVEQSFEVVTLENGLVSMEKTPEHLVKIVQRNAAESPLLRLPGEIRNKIYTLAMGGQHVEVSRCSRRHKGYEFLGGAVQHNNKGVENMKAAFHLPEVCRQIYSEAATLAYEKSIFLYAELDCRLEEWATQLPPAHLNAITTVRPDIFLVDQLVGGIRQKPIKTVFPGLKHIIVASSAAELVSMFNRDVEDTEDTWELEGWEEWIVGKMKKQEGEDVEVSFEET